MANGKGSGLAQELAGAPLVGRTGDPAMPTAAGVTVAAPLKVANRFLDMGKIRIIAIPERGPYVYPSGAAKGTKQFNLAEILLENVNGWKGFNYTGFRIIKKVSPEGGKVTISCVEPKIGPGQSKVAVLNVTEGDETMKAEYFALQDEMLKTFYTWAKERKGRGLTVHEGKVATALATASESMDADKLADEYGI